MALELTTSNEKAAGRYDENDQAKLTADSPLYQRGVSFCGVQCPLCVLRGMIHVGSDCPGDLNHIHIKRAYERDVKEQQVRQHNENDN